MRESLTVSSALCSESVIVKRLIAQSAFKSPIKLTKSDPMIIPAMSVTHEIISKILGCLHPVRIVTEALESDSSSELLICTSSVERSMMDHCGA